MNFSEVKAQVLSKLESDVLSYSAISGSVEKFG